MLSRICTRPGRVSGTSARAGTLACALALGIACSVHAESTPGTDALEKGGECLPDHAGFLRARLTGSASEELNWSGSALECTGGTRPEAGGIRLRFTQSVTNQAQRWVLVFGISRLKEGQRGRALPTNVTLIREGTGEFYSTQGDDKCTIDDIRQVAIVGIPRKTRSYRVTARGFCTEPARSLKGTGAILISRFDFEGRLDFESESLDERNVKR